MDIDNVIYNYNHIKKGFLNLKSYFVKGKLVIGKGSSFGKTMIMDDGG